MKPKIPLVVGIIGIVLFLTSTFYVWFSLDLFVSTDVGTFTTRADMLPTQGLKVELSGHAIQSLTGDQLRPIQEMAYVTAIYGSNILEVASFIILIITFYLAMYTAYLIYHMHKKRGLGDKLLWIGAGSMVFLVVFYLILTVFIRGLSTPLEEPISLGLVAVNSILYSGFLFNFGTIVFIMAAATTLCAGLLYREKDRTSFML